MIPILQAKSGIPVPAPRSTRHTGGWGASVAPEREAKGGSRAPRQHFWILLAGVLLPIAPLFSARGEDAGSHLLSLSVEELGAVKVDTVFEASKFTEKVTNAPSSVTIVTRDEVSRFSYRTLDDVVRSVHSFDITYDCEYSYTSARGYNRLSDYGARTLLLVDGHRMNDSLYDYKKIGLYPTSGGPPLTNNDSLHQYWWDAEASVGREFQSLDAYRFTMGTELYRSMQLRLRDYDEVAPLVFADANFSQQVAGAYVDTHTQFTKQLGLAAGVRFDYYDTFGDTLNRRFGLICKPWDRTTIKLLYGQAFRAPDAQESKFDLQPETIRTYELVAERYLGRHGRASASLFGNSISDFLDYLDESSALENSGKARVRGGEVKIAGKSDGGWLFQASYSRQLAIESDTGVGLINSPDDMAKMQVGIPLYRNKLNANIEGLFVGDRQTLLRRKSGLTYLLNATLFTRKVVPNVEFSASIYTCSTATIACRAASGICKTASSRTDAPFG